MSSSIHTKPSMVKSKSRRSISLEATPECPTTPLSCDTIPSKSSKPPKHDKELKLLTNMVTALAQKLKKRDLQVEKLQEKADQYNEVFLKLESSEERMADMAIENKSLSRRVRGLQSTIKMQDVEESGRWNKQDQPESGNSTANTTSSTEELREVRLQRDSAMAKAGEMAMALAESRSETDELRDQLAAVTEMMQNKNQKDDDFDLSLSDDESLSGVPPRTTQGNMKDLGSMWSSCRSMSFGGSSRALFKGAAD
jgi:hypothetical protein